ncbi:MAG: hypothetical protein JW994_01455, partial [Candidatus Omnitrophica bacterium]|nr:hypothetical protein [Candidatus Omnitrophota bacterium]
GMNIKRSMFPDRIFLTRDGKVLELLFSRAPLQYLVIDKVSQVQKANPNVYAIIGKYFALVKRFDDFIILKKK